MSISVRIPTALRPLAGGRELVAAAGRTVGEVMDSLEAECPGMKKRLCDESGAMRRFVNVYLNGEDVRFLSGIETPVEDGAELSIVPAVAGG